MSQTGNTTAHHILHGARLLAGADRQRLETEIGHLDTWTTSALPRLPHTAGRTRDIIAVTIRHSTHRDYTLAALATMAARMRWNTITRRRLSLLADTHMVHLGANYTVDHLRCMHLSHLDAVSTSEIAYALLGTNAKRLRHIERITMGVPPITGTLQRAGVVLAALGKLDNPTQLAVLEGLCDTWQGTLDNLIHTVAALTKPDPTNPQTPSEHMATPTAEWRTPLGAKT